MQEGGPWEVSKQEIVGELIEVGDLCIRWDSLMQKEIQILSLVVEVMVGKIEVD